MQQAIVSTQQGNAGECFLKWPFKSAFRPSKDEIQKQIQAKPSDSDL